MTTESTEEETPHCDCNGEPVFVFKEGVFGNRDGGMFPCSCKCHLK